MHTFHVLCVMITAGLVLIAFFSQYVDFGGVLNRNALDLFNGIQLPVIYDKALRVLSVKVRCYSVPDFLGIAICQKDNIIWSAIFCLSLTVKKILDDCGSVLTRSDHHGDFVPCIFTRIVKCSETPFFIAYVSIRPL